MPWFGSRSLQGSRFAGKNGPLSSIEAATMTGCPDENVLSELVRGELGAAARAEAEAHFDECADCRMLVSELAKSPSMQAHAKLASSIAPTHVVDADLAADTEGGERAARLPVPIG